MLVIGDIIRLNAKRFPNKKALITDEDYLTYFDLNSKANQLAHGLLARGTKPGDRISIIAFNSLDWMVVFFAVAKIGAILVPINFRYKKDEFVYLLNHSGSNCLFFGPDFTSLVEEVQKEANNPPFLIQTDTREKTGGMAAFMEGMPTTEPTVNVEATWPFSIIYTSGTTGKPKGALTQHCSLMHNYISMMVDCDVQDDEVCLASLPFFHTAGIHCLCAPVFLKGGTCVIISPGFDAEKVLDTIARHRITTTLWVPTQLAILLNSPQIDKYDISSLKKVWYGSSPIPPPVLEASLKKIKADFYQVYGETETLMVSVQRPEDHFGERSQYTGREFFNAELRIVDEKGLDVEIGGVGEIISRQQGSGMLCYYKDEEVTGETIRDGWIHTGDLARVEDGGYFTIVDRIKDLIISGGENVYPKEIENIISTHPAVKEVAVYGIPDDLWGESVCAAVVRNDGQKVDEKDIINFCADKLSKYKKPSRVIFMEELPRNSLGKVTKNNLRQPFWAGRTRRI